MYVYCVEAKQNLIFFSDNTTTCFFHLDNKIRKQLQVERVLLFFMLTEEQHKSIQWQEQIACRK